MAKRKTSGESATSMADGTDKSKSEKIQSALYQIADAASAMMDMQEFYAVLHRIMRGLMYAENFYVTLYDPTTHIMSAPYFADEAGDTPPAPSRLEDYARTLRAHVLRTGKTLHVSGEDIEEGKRQGIFEPMGTPAEDWIGVPLTMGGQVIGSLTIQSYQKGMHYDEQDVRLLEFIAQHIAVALTRARAIDETRQRNSELAIINSVQAALAEERGIHGIYDAVGEKLREIFSYQDVTVYSVDLKAQVLTVEYSFEKGRKFERITVPMNSMYDYIVAANRTLIFNGDLPKFAAQFHDYKIPQGEMPKSGLLVPVPRKTNASLVVYLTLQDVDGKRFFSDSDVRLLETLASSMSVALENARLFDEIQQRNSELAILNSLGEAMAKTLDVRTVTKIVGDKVRDIFSADQMGILLFEQQTNLIHVLYGYDKAHDRYLDDTMIKPLPLGKGLTSKVIELHRPLLLSTREEQDGYGHYMPPELVGQIKMSESWLGIPIMVNENVLGVVFVEDYRPHAYNENHLRLLQTLSANMGVAIQNARLFEETQRLLKETEQRAAELAVINSIQAGLASKLEMQAIYNLIGEKIRNIFKAETVAINQYDQEHDLISTPYLWSQGRRLSNEEPTPLCDSPLRKYMIDSGKSWVINRDSENITESLHASPDEQLARWPKSGISTPVIASNKVIGLIQILNMEQENTFTDVDLHLLETITNSMSIALENARLWEQEKLYRKALERELEIGREIQAGFLPEALPLVEGWEIAAALMSAREVAGDFYDAFELPDGTIGLVIADVCDKGVGAALFMTLFRSLVRVIANQDYFEETEAVHLPTTTGERLRHSILLTNNYIAETHGGSGMFATLFFGILDPRDGKLAYINGGHEPPLLLRSGRVWESLRKSGPAVGLIPNARFELLETCLQTGDTFFAYTDGVPDCTDPRGAFYGRERLHETLSHSSASALELVRTIETELRQYIGSANQFDDITLLAVRRA